MAQRVLAADRGAVSHTHASVCAWAAAIVVDDDGAGCTCIAAAEGLHISWPAAAESVLHQPATCFCSHPPVAGADYSRKSQTSNGSNSGSASSSCGGIFIAQRGRDAVVAACDVQFILLITWVHSGTCNLFVGANFHAAVNVIGQPTPVWPPRQRQRSTDRERCATRASSSSAAANRA